MRPRDLIALIFIDSGFRWTNGWTVGHMLCHKIHFRPRMTGDLDVILSNNKDFAP